MRQCALVYHAPEVLTGPVRARLLAVHHAASTNQYDVPFCVTFLGTCCSELTSPAPFPDPFLRLYPCRNADAVAILMHLLRQIERNDLSSAFTAPAGYRTSSKGDAA